METRQAVMLTIRKMTVATTYSMTMRPSLPFHYLRGRTSNVTQSTLFRLLQRTLRNLPRLYLRLQGVIMIAVNQ